jgi:hypothetical protein
MILSRPNNVKRVVKTKEHKTEKDVRIDKLLDNEITCLELEKLREEITAEDLSDIIQRIYDLNEKYILELSAVEGILRKLDDVKNARRNRRFLSKIKNEFRDLKDTDKKVILAEGDSWFNYPIILTDIIDRIAMEKNFAVYSLASGGDWLLNMLTARHYVEELSVLHPDVFLISGGGNDLVGSRRLAAMLEPLGLSMEYEKNEWINTVMKNREGKFVPLDEELFAIGVGHLSKDFFALIMFFHLQYYFLIDGILKHARVPGDKFYGIKIITQGYDYPLPSYKKRFGLNPLKWYLPFIRTLLGHGSWLKTPLLIRGIKDERTQRAVLYAMIYMFNEMMINMGDIMNRKYPNSVFHIDSRMSVGENGWTDELHPRPEHFLKTGNVFVGCINGKQLPTYGQVFVVKEIAK